MTADAVSLRPLLRGYPDARLAQRPLLDAALFPYVALMFGSPVAALVSCYNAGSIRRPGLVARSLLLGVLGWIAFVTIMVMLPQSGVAPAMAGVAGRLVYFLVGAVLFMIHKPYVRGHEYLGGELVSTVQSYMVALMISIFLPRRVLLILLLGYPLGF